MRKALSLLIVCCLALTAAAQQSHNPTEVGDVIPEATQAMKVYDFDRAIALLEQKITAESLKKKGRQPVVREEALLDVARRHRVVLSATEVVTIIDSVSLPKQEVLQAIRLSEESGSIDSYAHYFQQPDSLDCSVFLNQLRNRVLFAKSNAQKRIRIYEQELIGAEWKEPELLQGLTESETEDVNYPFMMSDGVTLYFAAQREEGLGGYDIYMTRYDNDAHRFLSAENIGMPFNSPANDYLMMIDEFNELGYFITDRNQPKDRVCLYTFIPNNTRRIYQDGAIDPAELRNRARITCIADTWTDPAAVTAAKERLAAAQSDNKQTEKKRDFEFVVNDRYTYYTLADFRKANAKELAQKWLEVKNTYAELQQQLESLRLQYAYGNEQTKNQLEPQIRILERNAEQAITEREGLAREIRRQELGKE